MQKLEIKGNSLVVNCDLLPYLARDFESKCEELLALDYPELVLDVSAVREIASRFVASLVHSCVAASEAGKKVTLKVPRALKGFFDFAEADPNLTVEIVGGE